MSPPLKINRDSCHIKKPSFEQQQRHPVIIYTHSPKIIRTHPRDFMALVQNSLAFLVPKKTSHLHPSPSQIIIILITMITMILKVGFLRKLKMSLSRMKIKASVAIMQGIFSWLVKLKIQIVKMLIIIILVILLIKLIFCAQLNHSLITRIRSSSCPV